jgi:hypothetical protein
MGQGSLTEGEGSEAVDLLVLTSLDHAAFYIETIVYLFNKTSYLNELNCTEPSPQLVLALFINQMSVDQMVVDETTEKFIKFNVKDSFTRAI